MGKTAILLLVLSVLITVSFQNRFLQKPHQLDLNQALRVDFILSGNHYEQEATIFRLNRDQIWSGSANQLISPFNYGEYRYFLIDAQTGDTLFARGFSTLFEEWRTTSEAKYKSKAFQQTIVMPFPKVNSRLVVEGRNRDGSFTKMMEEIIEPEYIDIHQPARTNRVVKIIHGEHQPAYKADLLIISEGYSFNELDIFMAEAKEITKKLFNTEPYKSLKKDFTVRTLAIPSPESGVTDPITGNWKDTYFKSRFNTFDIDRYLQTMETWRVFETAAIAPYDHIIILVNSKKYGGGGIYNHFSILTSGNKLSGELLLHEIGHGYGGLGDEYYDSDVAFTDYINLSIEPWQPNLTTLVDFNRKWKHLIKPSTPIPTPVKLTYLKETGVFEGGGYVAKKVYRPAVNCIMHNLDAPIFCEVCSLSITKVTKFYTL